MNILLSLLLCAVTISSASSNTVKCIDQYGHCPEWSKAGFCNINGYKTYMNLMCSYSCSMCKDHIELPRASGEERDGQQPGSASELQTEESPSTPAESTLNEENGNNEERLSSEDKASANEAVNPTNKPSLEEKQQENDSQRNDKEEAKYGDTNPSGVRNITMPQDLPDDINPRSEITRPISQLSYMVHKLKKTIEQSNKANQKAVADLYAAKQSTNDATGTSSGAEVVTTDSASGSAASESSDEMKDIAGEIQTGSKIFEEDIAEPESTSGCSSGYGCYSGLGEQVKQSQVSEGDEAQELELRSKIDIPEPPKQIKINRGQTTKEHTIDGQGEDAEGRTNPVNIDGKNKDETAKDDIDPPTKDKTAKTDIDVPLEETHKDKNIDQDVVSDDEKSDDRPRNDDITTGSGHIQSIHTQLMKNKLENNKYDEQNKAEKEEKVKTTTTEDKSSGSGMTTVTSVPHNDQILHKESTNPIIDTTSGSGSDTKETTEDAIDRISKEDAEEEDIDGLKAEAEKPVVVRGKTESSGLEEEQNDEELNIKSDDDAKNRESSGSGEQNLKEDNIEDALFEKGTTARIKPKKEDSETPIPEVSAVSENMESEKTEATKAEEKSKMTPKAKDLTSSKNKERLTSIENMITNNKLKIKPYSDAQASARAEMPQLQDKVGDEEYLANKIGKSHKVSLILDQHFYKPYINEDSMAYEMLALDLKKEVERAVGGQALVSQIKFSEIKKPGKLPSYSRVLASFSLYGDEEKLHQATRKGIVGDIMVDKSFYQST